MRVELDGNLAAGVLIQGHPNFSVRAGTEKPSSLVAGNVGRRLRTLTTQVLGLDLLFRRLLLRSFRIHDRISFLAERSITRSSGASRQTCFACRNDAEGKVQTILLS